MLQKAPLPQKTVKMIEEEALAIGKVKLILGVIKVSVSRTSIILTS